MNNLEELARRSRVVDTGLKACVSIAIPTTGCSTAGEFLDYFSDNGIFDSNFNAQRREEALLTTLRQFEEEGIIELGDRGKASPHESRYRIEGVDEEKLNPIIALASNSVDVCSEVEFPVHEFWRVRGGSYSTKQKPILQGVQLSAFYGFSVSNLEEGVNFESHKSEELIRSTFAQRLGITEKMGSHYLKKFQDMGLVERSAPLGKKLAAEYGTNFNARTYSLTLRGEELVSYLFLTELQRVANTKGGTVDVKPTTQQMRKVMDLHYSGFRNQYNA